MSTRWPGGIINQTAPVPSGTFATSAASGLWTLEQQAYWKQQGIWPIPGNFIPYVEDVFSTYLYTGNSSTQTITNGIDLAGKGGLVWIKQRNETISHTVVDTVRGNTKIISTNNTGAQGTYTTAVTGFNSNGFSLGNDSDWGGSNTSGGTYVSWTFREQAKFFDVVTWTGNGAAGRTISHNLGSAPGMIIIKQTDTSRNWIVYHRSAGSSGGFPNVGTLDTTDAFGSGSAAFFAADPTSTNFTIGNSITVNQNGGTYVAYLFAHNAGGFGLSGNENVISCGSYTGTGASGNNINLGYEPQWVMIKVANTGGVGYYGWCMFDNMRGVVTNNNDNILVANSNGSENGAAQNPTYPYIDFTSTGFNLDSGGSGQTNEAGNTYIYMAIRRGPMKVPTLGTSVFSPIISSGSTGTVLTTGFPVDLQMLADRDGFNEGTNVVDRLRGVSTTTTNSGNRLLTASTAAENSSFLPSRNWNNTGFAMPSSWGGGRTVFWNFGRAPGFFDIVCYKGTGVNGQTFNHNLGVTPELVIVKARDSVRNWPVYPNTLASGLILNLTGGFPDYGSRFTSMSATTFGVSNDESTNNASFNYVAYLFATCPGVSKVGSYTGNGSTQTIACGFTGGARFVLIKRTNSTGDWYVYDTARGMVVNTDPYLVLNTTAAEVATNNSVITTTGGFSLTTSFGDTNASGGTYIFLAIA
jgi:hypothetical protein